MKVSHFSHTLFHRVEQQKQKHELNDQINLIIKGSFRKISIILKYNYAVQVIHVFVQK